LALRWRRDTNTHADGHSDCDSNGYCNSNANGDAYNDFKTYSNTQAGVRLHTRARVRQWWL